MFFFYNIPLYSNLKTDYNSLALEIKKLKTQIEPKVIQLERLLEENKHGRMVFDPPYWISKANSNSSGQYYIGKIVIPRDCIFNPQKGKLLYLNFYLGKTDSFKDQMDSELISKAIEKSRNLVEKRIFFGSSKHFTLAKNLYLQEIEEIKTLEIEVANLKKQLDDYQHKFKEISVVVAPNISISETKSKSMGQYYFGKVRIPAHSVYNPNIGKVLYLNFYLGKTNDFEGKTDIKLRTKAELLAESIIRRKLFHETLPKNDTTLVSDSIDLKFGISEVNAESKGRRVPERKYPRRMSEYFTEIAENWNFPKTDDVTFYDLITKFIEIVYHEIIQTHGKNHADLFNESIGIKDRNLIGIQIRRHTKNDSIKGFRADRAKKIFYYPEFSEVQNNDDLKDRKIAPLRNILENHSLYNHSPNKYLETNNKT
jgi:regulator of replication initiation timing